MTSRDGTCYELAAGCIRLLSDHHPGRTNGQLLAGRWTSASQWSSISMGHSAQHTDSSHRSTSWWEAPRDGCATMPCLAWVLHLAPTGRQRSPRVTEAVQRLGTCAVLYAHRGRRGRGRHPRRGPGRHGHRRPPTGEPAAQRRRLRQPLDLVVAQAGTDVDPAQAVAPGGQALHLAHDRRGVGRVEGDRLGAERGHGRRQ